MLKKKKKNLHHLHRLDQVGHHQLPCCSSSALLNQNHIIHSSALSSNCFYNKKDNLEHSKKDNGSKSFESFPVQVVLISIYLLRSCLLQRPIFPLCSSEQLYSLTARQTTSLIVEYRNLPMALCFFVSLQVPFYFEDLSFFFVLNPYNGGNLCLHQMATGGKKTKKQGNSQEKKKKHCSLQDTNASFYNWCSLP